MSEDEYAASAFLVGSMHGPRCAVLLPERSRIAECPTAVVRAILLRPAPEALDQRARRLAEELPSGGGVAEWRQELQRLVAAGVLVSKRDLLAVPRTGPAAPPARVEMLAVPTRDRPAALRRCLQSFLDHARAHGRALTLVVADSTPEGPAAQQERAALEAWAQGAGAPLLCAGLSDKASFAVRLAAVTGVAPRLVEFALGVGGGWPGGDTGANRNALLLGLAGAPFLMADDDTRASFRALGRPGDDLVVSGDADPTRVSLFRDREAVERATEAVSVDLLAEIERHLGAGAGALLARQPLSSVRLHGFNRALVARLQAREAQVAAVSTGLWGDSGVRFPGFYLWSGAHLREQLCQGEARYAELVSSREVVRQAAARTLASGPFLMSTCVALDGRLPLPPFTPAGRGEDLVFGQTLASMSDASFLVHLPCCVAHAPTDGRSARAPALWDSSGAVELPAIVEACLAMAAAGVEVARSGEARLRLLGAHLEAMAERPWPELERALQRQLWFGLVRRLEAWDLDLARHGAAAPYWARDLAACRAGVFEQARHGAPVIPGVFEVGRAPAEAAAALQAFLVDLGRLWQSWPALVAGARRLREAGTGLFAPGHEHEGRSVPKLATGQRAAVPPG